ncbi:hypothetical protein JEOAER750_01689 [Jeotgalicoccus aerolatus]|uniref:Membrane protein SirB2 n=1 Tax=Jeotgalicoccus aerolatus TaxID=709510 RepID=A0ABS4HK02_9STAP|nr:DUF1516 family protein [Jeotgalicoccus aerolatus]MBP1951250.1 putative membrane protein SirB2 [Jeotgalicoccus aerolatus]NMA81667.1 DUF1516 family protein [Jeotgalicoccus aerolatus]CAD2077459.1 hypothetical protein JEOAER750_01689 [Jeotgalicoccus aerolatus]GGD98957.1 UPF0344 protein [Jeotgalicoccus aerolatus]HJG32960.1 DUF1516 family protein [Jeotgalicoccus aerolatus]
MLHLHLTAIIVSLILFIAVFAMYKKNNSSDNKPALILHMVLRVFYLLVLFSGIMIYVGNMEGISAAGSHMQYGIKALLGILSVVFMEVAVVRLKKHSASANVLLVVTLILIIAAVIMGSTLPLGMLSF